MSSRPTPIAIRLSNSRLNAKRKRAASGANASGSITIRKRTSDEASSKASRRWQVGSLAPFRYGDSSNSSVTAMGQSRQTTTRGGRT